MITTQKGLLNWYSYFFLIWLILDIENWLWKYDFATFWGSVAKSIYKIQQFHLNTVDVWVKTLVFKDPSSKKLHDVTDITEGADIIGMSICLSAHFVPKTQISTGLWIMYKKIWKFFQFATKFMLNFNLWPKKRYDATNILLNIIRIWIRI